MKKSSLRKLEILAIYGFIKYIVREIGIKVVERLNYDFESKVIKIYVDDRDFIKIILEETKVITTYNEKTIEDRLLPGVGCLVYDDIAEYSNMELSLGDNPFERVSEKLFNESYKYLANIGLCHLLDKIENVLMENLHQKPIVGTNENGTTTIINKKVTESTTDYFKVSIEDTIDFFTLIIQTMAKELENCEGIIELEEFKGMFYVITFNNFAKGTKKEIRKFLDQIFTQFEDFLG